MTTEQLVSAFLANATIMFGIFIYIGRKLSILERIEVDAIKSRKRVDDHSAEIKAHTTELAILSATLKHLPEQVNRISESIIKIETLLSIPKNG